MEVGKAFLWSRAYRCSYLTCYELSRSHKAETNSAREVFLRSSQALDGETLGVPSNLLNTPRRADPPNATSCTSEVLQTRAQVLL